MQLHLHSTATLSVVATFPQEVLQRDRVKQAVQHYHGTQDSRSQRTWLQLIEVVYTDLIQCEDKHVCDALAHVAAKHYLASSTA